MVKEAKVDSMHYSDQRGALHQSRRGAYLNQYLHDRVPSTSSAPTGVTLHAPLALSKLKDMPVIM